MKDKRKAYEEKLDAQFGEWNAQIVLLKAKAAKAQADAKIGYYKQIEALEQGLIIRWATFARSVNNHV